jgi:ferrochelatase
VIDLPWLGRKLLVNGIIVPFRAPKSAKIYKKLWDHGDGKSPLLVYSEKVKELLQGKFVNESITVEMAMR